MSRAAVAVSVGYLNQLKIRRHEFSGNMQEAQMTPFLKYVFSLDIPLPP
jgi:hypothetical protein